MSSENEKFSLFLFSYLIFPENHIAAQLNLCIKMYRTTYEACCLYPLQRTYAKISVTLLRKYQPNIHVTGIDRC